MKTSYQDLFRQIQTGDIGRLYLLWGEERFVLHQALTQLRAALLGEDGGLGEETFDADRLEWQALRNACDTLPLFAERRLVVVRDALPAAKASWEDEFAKSCADLPDTVCAVLIAGVKPDGRRALLRAVNEHGQVVEFPLLRPAEKSRWVTQTAKKQGKALEPAALNLFVERAPAELFGAANQLNRLMDLAGDAGTITVRDVRAIAAPLPEDDVFRMVEAGAQGRGAEAVTMLDQLLEGGESEFGLLRLLGRQFRLLLRCKEIAAQEKKPSMAYVADQLGVKPFVAEKCWQQSRRFDEATLRALLERCVDIEYRVKSGRSRMLPFEIEALLMEASGICRATQ